MDMMAIQHLGTLAIQGEEIGMMAVGGGVFIAILGMLVGTSHERMKTREREQTKREIAAYVAERSMTPEEGERLLLAMKGK